MVDRRSFLASWVASPILIQQTKTPAGELHCDVAVVGGGTGGVAAALAALQDGARVILAEEADWLGGQLTAQAVPPDEHPWIEQFGCPRSDRQYREAVRAYYRQHYPLTAAARPCRSESRQRRGVQTYA